MEQNMEYQVLARKWRPNTFPDLIGQEHITRTLQNALLSQKTAHAYLFVGPRGIGKTSIARIFAKTLNCEKAPVANPCCECESCISIANGNNIDIIEIDGASNNSVNDIRNLREEVLYSPVKCKYKVYIIDEVHMLSNQAWNALLKTLEEPPGHIKFLFATTEAHKILPTVLSRCQRFDLKRIPENLIVERLYQIAESEKVKISKNAIRAISKTANGGMRDALSLLDQMIAFHISDDNKEISEEQVFKTFGLTAPEDMENLIRAILTDNKSEVVLCIHKQASAGLNLEQLFNDILNYLRGIEICLLVSDPDSILEVGNDIIVKYQKLSQISSITIVQRLLETLSPTGKVLHDSLNKQIYLETILLKSIKFARSSSVEDLIIKINELKKKNQLHKLNTEVNIAPPPSIPVCQKKIEPASHSINQGTAPDKNINEQIKTDATKKIEPVNNTQASLETEIPPPPPEDQYFQKKSNEKIAEPPSNYQTFEKNIIHKQEKAKSIEIAPPLPPPIVKFNSPEELWHQLIQEMDADHLNHPQLKYYMQEAKPKSIDNNTLTVCYDEEFESLHADRIKQDLSLLNTCIARITGIRNFTLKVLQFKGLITPVHETKQVDLQEIREKISNNAFVQKTLELFDGNIVDVRG